MKALENYIKACCLFLLIGIAYSCGNVSMDNLQPDKFAFGKAGSVVVYMEHDKWHSPVGDSIKYYYGAAYPILPQPEPMFSLTHHTPRDLTRKDILRQLRTFLIPVNISDKQDSVTQMVIKDIGEENIRKELDLNDYGVKIGRNKWAENQLIFYVYARDNDKLIEGLKDNFSRFSRIMDKHDFKQYEATLFAGGNNKTLEKELAKRFNIKMNLPLKWVTAVEDENMMWLRYEKAQSSNSILVTRIPYQSESQFSEENMVALRDSLTRKYISSPADNSYMRINNVDLPTFYYKKEINGSFATELRGIWDMQEDFMGGPFTTYLILDKKNSQLIFFDVFVLAPGETKRELIRQLRYLAESIIVKQ